MRGQGFSDAIYNAEQQYRFARDMESREARADDHERYNGDGGREVNIGDIRDALETIDKFLWDRRTDASKPTDYRDAIREIHDIYRRHIVLRLQGEIQ